MQLPLFAQLDMTLAEFEKSVDSELIVQPKEPIKI